MDYLELLENKGGNFLSEDTTYLRKFSTLNSIFITWRTLFVASRTIHTWCFWLHQTFSWTCRCALHRISSCPPSNGCIIIICIDSIFLSFWHKTHWPSYTWIGWTWSRGTLKVVSSRGPRQVLLTTGHLTGFRSWKIKNRIISVLHI